jgi:predicted Zn-dependent peptidase
MPGETGSSETRKKPVKQMAKIVQFDNGMRLVLMRRRSVASASLAIWVGIGSRCEPLTLSGGAHFLEHLLFQGSSKWPSSRQISEAIEGIGGVLEAYTGYESTCFFSKVPSYRLKQAFDVLTDMVLHPLLREEDLEKERRVVIEEIRMHHDQPGDLGEILLFQLLYPDHPLGRDIAGSEESLANFTLPLLRSFWQESYCGHNLIVVITGDIDPGVVTSWVEEAFSELPPGHRVTFEPASKGGSDHFRVESKETAEAHLCLGGITLSRQDPDRYALGVMNTALGVGGSSRLYNEVRDRYGLAYYVHSSLEFFQDSGCQIVEAGCVPEKVPQVLELIRAEMSKLAQRGLDGPELARVVEYIKGGFLLRLEDSLAQALWLGEHLLLENKLPTVKEKIRCYEQVTVDDVQRVAQRVFRDSNYCGVVIGPMEDEKCWDGFRASS